MNWLLRLDQTGTRRMSKIMLGDLQNPQEGFLNGREGLRQVTLLAHAEDDYTLELPGHHVGAQAADGLIIPTRERCVPPAPNAWRAR
jgi:hypothetical protein